MTAKQLQAKFDATGKHNRDFIQWVKRVSGVEIQSSEVTSHRNGDRNISRAFAALYSIYFKIIELT